MTAPAPTGEAGPSHARPGFLARLGFTRRTDAPPLNIVDTIAFETPSAGDAFNFSVIVHFRWTASGSRHRWVLSEAILDRRRLDERHVRQLVREAVRQLPPWDAAVAERHANQYLMAPPDGMLGRESHQRGVSTTCSAWAQIDITEPVRQYQQRKTRAVAGSDAHVIASRKKLETLTALRQEWLAFLGGDTTNAEGDWRSPFATQLAEGGAHATDTVASMHWRRRRDVTFAISFYSDVIRQFRKAGDYDFAVSVEDTLNKMVQAYGLPQLDLIGEMLRDDLIPSDEIDPKGHMFGEDGDGRGPAHAELFGGPATGSSHGPGIGDPGPGIYDYRADDGEDPDEGGWPDGLDDETPPPSASKGRDDTPKTPSSDGSEPDMPDHAGD
jgi:hypothetical protein